MFATPTAQIVCPAFLTLFADAIPYSTSSRFTRFVEPVSPLRAVGFPSVMNTTRFEPELIASWSPASQFVPPAVLLYTASIVVLREFTPACVLNDTNVFWSAVAVAAKLKIFICDGVNASALTKLFAAFAYVVLFGVIEPDRSSTSETFSPHPAVNAGFDLRFTNRRVVTFELLTVTCWL